MTNKKWFSRRHWLPLAVLVALLTVGVTAALASKPKVIEKGIQYQNTNCDGTDNGNDKLGKAIFQKKPTKPTLTLTVNFKAGAPNATYTIYVLDADDSCSVI